MKYVNPIMEGADPFILTYEGKYYLYCTKDKEGFRVFESRDLKSWEDKGFCLVGGQQAYGDKGFWAPEIMLHNGVFYMVYVANEHLAIATSKSPLGPFIQEKVGPIDEEMMIDGHFFVDDDGTIYLYFVRFTNGNVIWAAKMNDDLKSFDKLTLVKLVEATEPWELSSGFKVAEGPFILKHDGKYYLSYSCNHTQSPDYAIGYAVSDSPLGEFKKYEGNPILAKNKDVAGVGHHSFFIRNDGQLMIVYHRHFSLTQNYPRQVCLDEAGFVNGVLTIDGPTK